MKIGIDVSQIAYEGTGSGRYVVELVKGLITIQPQLHEYILFGSARKRLSDLKRLVGSEFASDRVRSALYPFPPRVFELIWNYAHLGNIEHFTGALDVYHSSDWTQAPSNACKVTTVHDLIPFLYPEFVHPRILNAHQARWKWIVKEVDQVIVDARCTKEDIINRFNFPAERISVIPLGVSDRFLNMGKEKNVRSNFNGKYILAVGTLEPRKNIQRLIDAYATLDTEFKAAYPLMIVGKSAWSDELRIPDGCLVKFTGYVEDAKLPGLYADAKLFVMPSLYEGFGIPVLEAMASFTPVLASNRSSLPEIGGDSIMYIDDPEDHRCISDALTKAITNYPKELAAKAFERAQGFRWEITAKKTLEVYNTKYIH